MASLFENISKEALVEGITPRTQASMAWFEDKLQAMSVNRTQLINQTPEFKRRSKIDVNIPLIGTMHMFRYEPLNRDSMKYYDRYPLVILVGEITDGFTALNLHYMPPMLRIKFLDFMYQRTIGSGKQERFAAYWDRINRGLTKKFLAPMVKSYRNDRIRGRIAQVFPDEWEIAAFLPFERFFKKTKDIVWRDSTKRVYRR